MQKHRILLISTGGTIAGHVATTKKGREDDTPQKVDSFSDLLKDTVLDLKKERDIEVIIEPRKYAEIDSSDIKPQNWSDLADIIYEEYDNHDSFVITHGTNTLGYTAAALSFAFFNNKKPIILTGSQVAIGKPGSDAKTNLDNAIRIACWNEHDIYGVVTVFGSHIISGTRAKKSTEFDYDAFTSFGTGSIGRIGRIIDIDTENLRKHNNYRQSNAFRLAATKSNLKVNNRFHMNICSLTEFPGMEPDILENLVAKLKIEGFILRAFGAGDAASELHKGLEYLKEKQIPIVITTQAPNGNANMQVNEPGQKINTEKLGIPAYDMSIESQTTKLAWLLARKEDGDITYEQLCDEMTYDIRGEINVMWESEYRE